MVEGEPWPTELLLLNYSDNFVFKAVNKLVRPITHLIKIDLNPGSVLCYPAYYYRNPLS